MSDYEEMRGQQPAQPDAPGGEQPAFRTRRRRSAAAQEPAEPNAWQVRDDETTLPGPGQAYGAPVAQESTFRVSGYPGDTSSRTQTRIPPQPTTAMPPMPRPASQEQPQVRRPVQAPGYDQRRPMTTAQTAYQPPAYQTPPSFGPELQREDELPEQPRRHRFLLALVILVLLLGAAALGLHLIPDEAGGTLGQIKSAVTDRLGTLLRTKPTVTAEPPVTVQGFTAAPTTGTAPLPVIFSVTTSTNAKAVRLVDEGGKELSTSAPVPTNNAETTIWVINVMFLEGYTGDVQAQVMGQDDQWQLTDKSVNIQIAAPIATAVPVTQAPDLIPDVTGTPEEDVLPETEDDASEGLPEAFTEDLMPEDLSGLSAEDAADDGSYEDQTGDGSSAEDQPAAIPQEGDAPAEESALPETDEAAEAAVVPGSELARSAPAETVLPEVISCDAYHTEGYAPQTLQLTVVTSASVEDLRLVDGEGEPLEAVTELTTETRDERSWSLTAELSEPVEAELDLQILCAGEWLDTEQTVPLSIRPEPTPEPTPELTEEPTAEPSPEAPVTQRPMATLSVTNTPAPDGSNTLFLDSPAEEPFEGEDSAAWQTEEDLPDEEAPEEWVDPMETSGEDSAPDDGDAPDEDLMPDDGEPVEEEVLPDEPAEEQPESPAEEPSAAQDSGAEDIAQESDGESRALVASAVEEASPSLIKTAVIYGSNSKKIAEYMRQAGEQLSFGDADGYSERHFGVLTFRGSGFRQNAAHGTAGNVSSMRVLWRAEAGSVKASDRTYYGIGKGSQPVIVQWSKEVREHSNIVDEKKGITALKEVIIAGEDGMIYFLDLADGTPTRDPINVGFPMRATPSIQTDGYPFMSVGQYARKMAKKTGDIGLRFFDLFTQKQIGMIDGLDGKLNRPYSTVGSFETSSLYDYHSDTLVSIGTNGMLYLTRLNCVVDKNTWSLSTKPATVAMKSLAAGENKKLASVESSVAAYQQYVFYADMAGILRCVDTNSLQTVWAVDTGDAVEAAVALDMDEAGNLWLYTANTLQNRKRGDCQVRCFNAMTGALRWSKDVSVTKGKSGITPGAVASPVIGTGELKDYVFFTLNGALQGDSKPAVLLCLRKDSGDAVWSVNLKDYSYSSPVAVYSEDGHGWIVQAAANGMIYLFNGTVGSLVHELQVEGTINGSPSVYRNVMVIGTQGKDTSFIYGIVLE